MLRTSAETQSVSIAEATLANIPRLRSVDGDEARLAAEVLLSHALGVTRAQLYARWRDPLLPDVERRYEELLRRHEAGEPVAYLVGQKEFFGLTFQVDRRAMIPRPETEQLVARALDWLPQGHALIAADVGTGCGNIAISLALTNPTLTVYAIDLSKDALALAEENIAAHNMAQRVQPLLGDFLTPLPGPVDLITANLPYVPEHEWEALPPAIRDYEPPQALRGGLDGLDHYRLLFALAPAYLKSPGLLLAEIGVGQGKEALHLAQEAFPQAAIRLHYDEAGWERIVAITQ